MNLFNIHRPIVIGLATLGLLANSPFHYAHALPEKGVVVAGTATFDHDSYNLVVKQESKYAVIEWTKFSIDHRENVLFITNGPTLNRVVGKATSTLDGYLGSNHALYLVNPNGVVKIPGGAMEIDHFVSSIKDISTKDFMAGLVDMSMGPLLTQRNTNNIYLNGMMPSTDKGVLGNIIENYRMKAVSE